MPARPRRQPQRSCVACRTKRPKAELVRLVLDADGVLRVDARGRAPGRGAYLCAQPGCWRRAAHNRSLGRALRRDLGEGDRALLEAGPPAEGAGLAGAGARYASGGETNP